MWHEGGCDIVEYVGLVVQMKNDRVQYRVRSEYVVEAPVIVNLIIFLILTKFFSARIY